MSKKGRQIPKRNLPATYFARADSRPRIMKMRLLEPETTLLQRAQEIHEEIVAVKGLDIVALNMVERGNTVLLIQPHNMIRYNLMTHNASSHHYNRYVNIDLVNNLDTFGQFNQILFVKKCMNCMSAIVFICPKNTVRGFRIIK